MTILNRVGVIFAVFVSVILLLSIGSCISNQQIESTVVSSSDPEPFYVGVTYCGDSVSEAKQLIDKVKTYTNLFVLQSGLLQFRPEEMNQIVDYAVDSNLHFIVYFGNQYWDFRNDWFETFDHRWDNHFLGVYFGDNPGGKMLDNKMNFPDDVSENVIRKMENGSVKIYFPPTLSDYSHGWITYHRDGTMFVEKKEGPSRNFTATYATYFTNNSIEVEVYDRDGFPIQVATDEYVPFSYKELENLNPFKSYTEASDRFIDLHYSKLVNEIRGYENVASFTSDYALHWFDYLSGYDVVFAQFGWNHSLIQDIALVRGAANLQNKNWGAIITWKYNHPPYLDSGEAIYEQMRTAYEAGAKYAVIFNYAENMTGPYGILEEEHFVALERFWNEVVQNPEVKQGFIKGEAALVLPKNYGWGMRRLDDTIWGLWDADQKSEQIWNLRCDLIREYGLNLDIVYDDPAFPVEGKYVQTFYTPTEKTESFPITFVAAAALIVAAISIGLLVYFKKRKHKA